MQYHLYTLDIILNQNRQPFLIDILYNPVYEVSKEDTKIIREKNKIYDDIIENFINYFAKFNTINYNNSKFIILNNITQYFDYKLLITKKVNDNFNESTEFLSNDGEKFLIKCLNDYGDEFITDNSSFLTDKTNKPIEKKNIILDSNFEKECIFEKKDEKTEQVIEKKINELINQESKEKIIGIASATLPLLLATYLAKKTYQSFTK